MGVKASLQIVLKANNVVVAKSDKPAVWQQALALITGPGKPPAAVMKRLAAARVTVPGVSPASSPAASTRATAAPPVDETAALAKFAAELKLDEAQVLSSCHPSTVYPHLRLDESAWRDFKRHTLPEGYNSIPQIVLATTLLTLWFRLTDLGDVTIKQGQDVLRTIGLRDKNAGRGLNHCEWLQLKGETVRLRPTKLTQALAVARAYCGHKPIDEPRQHQKAG